MQFVKVENLKVNINLNGIKKNYDRSASRDIGRILNNIPGWERGEKPARLQDYGVQKYWEKTM